MADRDNVIKALEICASGTNSCDKCPMKDRCKGVSNAAMVAAIGLLKEQEPIIRCKDCKYGLYTGTEYLCDRHSGHVNRFGEDQYYKEWHNGNWFCADGERWQEE